uniref:Uncharacterized protein n=1 Tax=Timema poppense TaxID=170557 RepID=A0A7R9DK95_TIMPO|nr:unnamed protein product [Timema poppensis]
MATCEYQYVYRLLLCNSAFYGLTMYRYSQLIGCVLLTVPLLSEGIPYQSHHYQVCAYSVHPGNTARHDNDCYHDCLRREQDLPGCALSQKRGVSNDSAHVSLLQPMSNLPCLQGRASTTTETTGSRATPCGTANCPDYLQYFTMDVDFSAQKSKDEIWFEKYYARAFMNS